MYQPILEEVMRLLGNNAPKGTDEALDKKSETISILTQTNEEAVIMLALLHSHGIKAKLVQSMDGLQFWNLAEVRYFLKKIDQGSRRRNLLSSPMRFGMLPSNRHFKSMPIARHCPTCTAAFRYLSKPIVPSTIAT